MLKSFHAILLYVSNIEETAKFYERLGFPVDLTNDGARVKLGNFLVAFIDENKTPLKNESGARPRGLGVFLSIETDNVDEYYRSLIAKGIRTSTSPRTWPWAKREFVVRDPEGYKLVFFSPLGQ